VKETAVVKETVVVQPTAPPKPETVEVTFWSAHGGNLGEVLQDLVLRFNATQDEVYVVNEFQGSYYDTLQKFLAAMAAGQVPDLVQLDGMYTPFMAARGAYANIDDLVYGPDGIDANDLLEGFAEGDKWDGHFYAWSYARSTPLLYINADAFKEAGLDPVPPATFAELMELAKVLTKKDASGETTQYGFQMTLRNWWYLESMFRSNGGRIFDPEAGRATLDEPEQIEVLQAIRDLIDQGYAKTAANSGQGGEDFYKGMAAMTFQSTASLNNALDVAPFEIAVGFIPKWKEYVVTPGGSVLAIAADSQKKEAAWKFLKWITSPELTAEYAMRTGYLPLRKSALETDRLKNFYVENPEYTVAVDQGAYAVGLPLIKAVPVVVENFFTMQEEIFVGGAPVEETAKKYGDMMTEEFQAWIAELE
jgi:sn-glycerol 3-phosphate transport system substrate-binding protein